MYRHSGMFIHLIIDNKQPSEHVSMSHLTLHLTLYCILPSATRTHFAAGKEEEGRKVGVEWEKARRKKTKAGVFPLLEQRDGGGGNGGVYSSSSSLY